MAERAHRATVSDAKVANSGLGARAGTLAIDQADLDVFRTWYNGIRPHQHLDNHFVPAEAWVGEKLRSSKPRYFNGWAGTLTGFY